MKDTETIPTSSVSLLIGLLVTIIIILSTAIVYIHEDSYQVYHLSEDSYQVYPSLPP